MDTSIFAVSNVSSYQRITARFTIARKHKLTQKINQVAYKQRNVQFSLSVPNGGSHIELRTRGWQGSSRPVRSRRDSGYKGAILMSKSALNSKNTISEVPDWDLSILKETYTMKIVKDFPSSVIYDLNA